MCVAAQLGNSNIVRLLLEEGADPSSTDENGGNSLHQSVEVQSVENTRLLLEAGAQLEARNLDDETPLMLAIRKVTSSSLDVIMLLLKYGADAGARYKTDIGCLHLAITYQGPRIFQLLLERGVDIEARSRRGDSILHYAARFNNAWLGLECLLAKHKDQGTLHHALETRNNHGCTPLYVAAYYNSYLNVETLLKASAFIEAREEDGDTPLHAAIGAVRRYVESTGSLDYNVWDDDIRKAIVESRPCRTIVTLLNAGADPLVKNDLGISPLDLAFSKPQFEALHGMGSWHTERKALVLESNSRLRQWLQFQTDRNMSIPQTD